MRSAQVYPLSCRLATTPQQRVIPSNWAAAAVALCGVCAFLELYCTQPLLPMLAHIFGASKTGVGMTVSAATLGVAISAPVFGALTERLPRKRVIVASLVGISLPTLLAATSTSLTQLVIWRFLQGVAVPGVIAVVVTYIGEEWPPERVALIMSFYVSGTALGGFLGRITAGILADHFNWRISFLVLGAAALAGAGASTSSAARLRTPLRPGKQSSLSGSCRPGSRPSGGAGSTRRSGRTDRPPRSRRRRQGPTAGWVMSC